MSDAPKMPISLEHSFFTKLTVEAIPGHEFSPKPLDHAPQSKLQVTVDEQDPTLFIAEVSIILNEEKNSSDPYFAEAICYAVFRKNNGASDEEARRATTVIGHNVAYGAIREAIQWITGRLPYGSLNLGLSIISPPSPTVNKQ